MLKNDQDQFQMIIQTCKNMKKEIKAQVLETLK